MRVFVEGIGLLGPGLAGWSVSRPALCGQAPFQPGDVALPPVAQLPAAERRRTGASVKLAIAVGLEALTQSGQDASGMATVFTSSNGDGDTIHAILAALATEQREISPTRFHNSLHNAASGYWALACAASAPSTSLCGFDGSFGIGLLDAAAQVTVDNRPVTLIAYDLPYPEPLRAVRRITAMFAIALVLTPQRTARSLAELTIRLHHDSVPGETLNSVPGETLNRVPRTTLEDAGLEALRRTSPAARSLPLLAALANGGGTVGIEGIDSATVEISVVTS
jgi:Beta-ketoacyl synthase, N-terminal domain